MNPYVFIVGCPRSGTTLLRRMVDAHPEIAISRETHWIPKLFKRADSVTKDGLVTKELLPALLAHPKFPHMRIDQDELEPLLARNGLIPYASFVTGIFDLYGAKRGKRLVGDKTPAYVREISTLHGLWPQARFVHLIRDGRDVGLSAINWERKAEDLRRRFPTWAEDPITTAALWWRWYVVPGREKGLPLGAERYYEMRYEDLVRDPEAECRSLCSFLEVHFDEAMLSFHEGRTRATPGLSAKHAWLPPTPGLRNWRSEMPTEALELFEAASGDLLDELGYPRGVPMPPTALVERASVIAAHFSPNEPKEMAAERS